MCIVGERIWVIRAICYQPWISLNHLLTKLPHCIRAWGQKFRSEELTLLLWSTVHVANGREKTSFARWSWVAAFHASRCAPTGKRLGVGSYGSVEEVELNGLVCAGKRLHDALLEQGNIGVADITSKYLQECKVINSASRVVLLLY